MDAMTTFNDMVELLGVPGDAHLTAEKILSNLGVSNEAHHILGPIVAHAVHSLWRAASTTISTKEGNRPSRFVPSKSPGDGKVGHHASTLNLTPKYLASTWKVAYGGEYIAKGLTTVPMLRERLTMLVEHRSSVDRSVHEVEIAIDMISHTPGAVCLNDVAKKATK